MFYSGGIDGKLSVFGLKSEKIKRIQEFDAHKVN